MRRREFITLLGGAAAWPVAAYAQKIERMRRIGVLIPYPETDPDYSSYLAVFVQALRNLGWLPDDNIKVEYRWDAVQADRRKTHAAELVGLKPDLIVAVTTPSVTALLNETRTVPIVFVQVSDPLGSGLVDNLARPSGNVTGFTNFEFSMGGKWLELLKQIAPNLQRVAVLFNPDTSPAAGAFYLRTIEAASRALMVEPVAAHFRSAPEIERALSSVARETNVGLVVTPDQSTTNNRHLIAALAIQHHIPSVYPFRFFATDGGLVSYGVDTADLFRRTATYVDRILKGATPADLPVQQPTKFELVLNLKTAKALGLEVPPMLLARADEVIE